MTKNRHIKGFTAVELAIVLIIFGMISGTLIYAFKIYNMQRTSTLTREAFDTTEAALMEFKIIHGRYPCPANPGAAPGDADYGVEDCAGANILIRVGERDTLADIEIPPAPPVNDDIMIGAIPINTMMLGPDLVPNTFDEISYIDDMSTALTLDGWQHKITYSVTASLTDSTIYNDFNGAIEVVDENDQSVLSTPASAHLVLISHGQNGRGAYKLDGTDLGNCGGGVTLPAPTPPAVNTPVNEIENCDENDGKFLSGLHRESDHSYNDDILSFVTNQSGALWRYSGASQVVNTNVGYVGFGTNAPTQHLHVEGDLLSDEFWAEQYTDNAGGDDAIPGDLFDPAYDDATDMECPAGQVVTAIENHTVTCGTPFTAGTAYSCPPGEYLHGISVSAGAICCTLGGTCP